MDLALPRSCPIAQGFDASHASDAARPSSAKDAFIATRQPNWPNLFIPICIGHDDTLYIEGRATYSPCQDQNGPIAPVFSTTAPIRPGTSRRIQLSPALPTTIPFSRSANQRPPLLPSPASALSLCAEQASNIRPCSPFRATGLQPSFVNMNTPPRLACPGGTFTIRLVSRPQLNGDDRPMPTATAMSEDILINVTPFETRVALVEQGAVQELHVERSIQRGHVGNIYLGRVVRVLPGMQSAFIDIGLERAAFIHIADLRENRGERSQGCRPRRSRNCCSKDRPSWSRWSRTPGHQGRSAVHADQHGRPHAGLSAA